MLITYRELMTALHGMGFAGLFLLGFSGALAALWRLGASAAPLSRREEAGIFRYLVGMAVLGWFAVLSGAYIVYPWYRAKPAAGVTDLSGFPQRSLLASATTAGWHNVGMEWKEHVAWFAPIAVTMMAFVFRHYAGDLIRHRDVRRAVLAFGVAAMCAAGIAGVFGAALNKRAPVQGGASIRLMP